MDQSGFASASLTSNSYAFYYPAILAFSLVFPTGVSVALSAAVLGFVFVTGAADGLDERVLVARLLTLAATAFIGWRYRRVEEQRRSRRAEISSVRGVYGSETVRMSASLPE